MERKFSEIKIHTDADRTGLNEMTAWVTCMIGAPFTNESIVSLPAS